MIIFDLDGTLLDVSRRFYRVYTDILDRFGYGKLSMTDYWEKRRNHVSTADIIRETCPEGFINTYYKIRNRWFEGPEYLNLDRTVPGAYRILDHFIQCFPLHLVTLRSNRRNLLNQLQRLGLSSYFEHILSGDRFGDWSEKYRIIKNSLSISPTGDWIVGDTEIDVIAGRKLGIRTCAVSTGIRRREILMRHHPDIIVEDVTVIPKLLRREGLGHGIHGRRS